MAYFLLSSDLAPDVAAAASEALSMLASSVAAVGCGGGGGTAATIAPSSQVAIGLGLLAKDSHGNPNSRIKVGFACGGSAGLEKQAAAPPSRPPADSSEKTTQKPAKKPTKKTNRLS
jgi:hypothetical protein